MTPLRKQLFTIFFIVFTSVSLYSQQLDTTITTSFELWGTTSRLGPIDKVDTTCQYGEAYGTIFKVDSVGDNFEVVYSFSTCRALNYGSAATLFQASSGLLYGSTYTADRNADYSMMFEIYPKADSLRFLPMADNMIQSLTGRYQRGFGSMGSITEGEDGSIYGTTFSTPGQTRGQIFQYNPMHDTVTAVLNLGGNYYEYVPLGGVVEVSGGLYGTSTWGTLDCLTAFRGALYKYNIQSGEIENCRSFEDLYIGGDRSRYWNSGFVPRSWLLPVIIPGGDTLLYGTTSKGGMGNGNQVDNGGTLFLTTLELDTIEVLESFSSITASNSGGLGNLIQHSNGKLYGTTVKGGNSGLGTIYEHDIGTKYTHVVKSFDVTNGSSPTGGLIEGGEGNMYGLATFGGSQDNNGALYEYNPYGQLLTPKVVFDTLKGTHPLGNLVRVESCNVYITRTQEECGSYLWPINGSEYSNSLRDTVGFKTIAGCDTTYILDLTILPATADTVNIMDTVCYAMFWPLSGKTYEKTGSYSVAFSNIHGCDSIIQLNLVVDASTRECRYDSDDKTVLVGKQINPNGDFSSISEFYIGNDSIANQIIFPYGLSGDTLSDFVYLDINSDDKIFGAATFRDSAGFSGIIFEYKKGQSPPLIEKNTFPFEQKLTNDVPIPMLIEDTAIYGLSYIPDGPQNPDIAMLYSYSFKRQYRRDLIFKDKLNLPNPSIVLGWRDDSFVRTKSGVIYGFLKGIPYQSVMYKYSPKNSDIELINDYYNEIGGGTYNVPLSIMQYSVDGYLYGLVRESGGSGIDAIVYQQNTETGLTKREFTLEKCSSNLPFIQADNDLLYVGTSSTGGDPVGVIFEYSPLENIFKKRVTVENAKIRLLAKGSNGKLYGVELKNNKYRLFEYVPGDTKITKYFTERNLTFYNLFEVD